ncbi:MAG: ATP-binding protein [Clostridia bacterium]|nr:ATP-binding protein [Clostridia bacterium]
MLKRKIESELLKWKNDKNKKSLIIEGARQVGKTFIIEHFAKENYENFIEINFIKNPSYKAIFEGDLDIDTILSNITLFTKQGNKLVAGKTLIFLDEIQNCKEARTALKFFTEDKRFDVIASGSLLGLHYNLAPTSYPTGYVDFMEMHSLSFEEFLWANEINDNIINNLRNCFEKNEKVNESVNTKILELFRQYIVVGGMPEVVNTFIETQDYEKVLKLQRNIVNDYRNDIANYAISSEKVKATACFNSIPYQLSRENKKFSYKIVEENGRSSKYFGSIEWLIDAGIVNISYCLSRLEAPLIAYVKEDFFKIYMADSGLLISMLDDGTNAQILKGNLGIYKGAIFENVIAKMLKDNGNKLYYFNRNNSLELDFVTTNNGDITPIEVKADNNKAKSLITILNENPKMQGFKLINGNIGKSNNLVTLPLYMAMFI